MGRLARKEPKYQVEELQARHREIIRLKMLGEDHKVIAERLGITPQMVANVVNSNIAKAHMEKLHGKRDQEAVQIGERLQFLSQEAVDMYTKILRGEDEGKMATIQLKKQVADEILDRAGFGKTTNVNVKSESLVLKADDIEEIKRRAAARKSAGATTVNATPA